MLKKKYIPARRKAAPGYKAVTACVLLLCVTFAPRPEAKAASAQDSVLGAAKRPGPGDTQRKPDSIGQNGPVLLGRQMALTPSPERINNPESLLFQIHQRWAAVAAKNAKAPAITENGCDMPEINARQWNNLRAKVSGKDGMSKLRAVNGFFNQWVSRSDASAYGSLEYWASPKEFIQNRGGDCEDYAIAKYFALKALGWPPDEMWVLLVKDKAGKGHAVLAARRDGVIHILDNLSRPKDLVLPQSKYVSVYTPFAAVNERGVWAIAKQRE